MALNRATEVMDALRDRFNALAYAQDPTLRVSLSIGLAPYQPNHADSTSWLNDADQALYEAKSSGRNRVSSVQGSWLRSV
jgi:diguanylate cyclase